MKNLLKKYEGKTIGYGFSTSKKLNEGVLIEVNDNYFTIENSANRLRYHYNYNLILCAIDSENGVKQKGMFKKGYPIVITLYEQVVYSGATGYGFGIMF